jgi:hypothetical protein
MEFYDEYYSDKKDENRLEGIDKILCILEGKDELIFLKKIYECYNSNIQCFEFMNDKVKVSWGKEPIYPDENCNFQGGNRPGCPVPRPAIESLKFEEDSLALYKGIIIMFDKDCDVDDEVEEKIMKIIKENNLNETSVICLSNPCLEKEAIVFFQTTETLSFISSYYREIDGSKCKWYKQNYAHLPKKDRFRSVQSLESLFNKLDKEACESVTGKLKEVIEFVKNKM